MSDPPVIFSVSVSKESVDEFRSSNVVKRKSLESISKEADFMTDMIAGKVDQTMDGAQLMRLAVINRAILGDVLLGDDGRYTINFIFHDTGGPPGWDVEKSP